MAGDRGSGIGLGCWAFPRVMANNQSLEGERMTSPLRLLGMAAALNVTLGLGTAAAQRVMVRHLPVGTPVEVMLNAETVGTGTVDETGDVTVPVHASRERRQSGARCERVRGPLRKDPADRDRGSCPPGATGSRGLRAARDQRALLGAPRQHDRDRSGAHDSDAAADQRILHAADSRARPRKRRQARRPRIHRCRRASSCSPAAESRRSATR